MQSNLLAKILHCFERATSTLSVMEMVVHLSLHCIIRGYEFFSTPTDLDSPVSWSDGVLTTEMSLGLDFSTCNCCNNLSLQTGCFSGEALTSLWAWMGGWPDVSSKILLLYGTAVKGATFLFVDLKKPLLGSPPPPPPSISLQPWRCFSLFSSSRT